MKVWTKVKLTTKNQELEKIVTAYVNYIFKDTFFPFLVKKYKIDSRDINYVYQKLAARIAGLIILYVGNDKKRLHDIFNKYDGDNAYLKEIIPEVEGYTEK